MIAQMSVRVILALFNLVKSNKQANYSIYLYENPSAGIGRQGELKIR